MAIVMVEVFDEQGNVVSLADNMISCEVKGGKFLGLESGCNTDMTDWTDKVHRAFRGRIIAYVRRDGPKTEIAFSSPYLKGCSITL